MRANKDALHYLKQYLRGKNTSSRIIAHGDLSTCSL